jgi:ATP-dependent RNA helicase RhlE
MSFTVFKFHPRIQSALDHCGYVTPTPVQEKAIPPVLAGRDILGLAQTGTGKTAAFVLPILQRLYGGPRGKVRALIVAPTRELAEQTNDYIGKMARETHLRSVVVYGGVSKQGQINKIKRGVDIIVACPGRLLDLLNEKVFTLSAVEMMVLDEADHMFDHGFLPDIRRILRALPRQRQTLVFSATMPKEIRSLVEDAMINPVTVQINHTQPAAAISHSFYKVEQNNKTALLKNILQNKGIATAIVFTRTKHKAKSLALQLQKTGCRATSLQGNLSQQNRQLALDGFKRGTYNILVATDIAARGIDVSGITHVINFDMPGTAETYTHRTGRTGRASCAGEAFTFVTADDHKMLRALERTFGKKMVYKQDIGIIGIPENSVEARTINDFPKVRKRVESRRGHRTSKRNQAVAFDFGI